MFKLFLSLLFSLIWSVPLFATDQTEAVAAKIYLQTLHKPQTIRGFKPLPHLTPFNQDTTNACWSFATLSFIESEMLRSGQPAVRLAVMFPVYYDFLEKARYYVQTRGRSRFAAGDLFSGALEIIKKYGIVPQQAYRGQKPRRRAYNHQALEKTLDRLMKRVKLLKLWDEDLVLAKVRDILNQFMGKPPVQFSYNKRTYTPIQFRDQIVHLSWKDYIMVTSFSYAPFYQFSTLEVPDNWAHRRIFFNVPLSEFYAAFKNALQRGYTVAFDSDIGEPGRMGAEDVAFIPPFDIPHSYINQPARELRFENGSTTDDHLMHIVGYKNFQGNDWFLVKDSWRTAWAGRFPGYYFFHGDYLKLKALAFLVNQKAVPEICRRLPTH